MLDQIGTGVDRRAINSLRVEGSTRNFLAGENLPSSGNAVNHRLPLAGPHTRPHPTAHYRSGYRGPHPSSIQMRFRTLTFALAMSAGAAPLSAQSAAPPARPSLIVFITVDQM